MLINVSEYSESLKKLWIDTFGDSEEYVSLFFDCGYAPAECFAEIVDGKAISVLYLLDGFIKTEEKFFKGRYLYAAATATEHRGKGIMAKLIREAQSYADNNNISFISLVPADEGLYGYYSRFGFEAVMKNFVSVKKDEGSKVLSDKDFSLNFEKVRNKLLVSYFGFYEKEMQYAVSCLDYAGYRIIRNTSDSYYIISADSDEVIEYVSTKENFTENTQLILEKLKEGTVITSPYDLSEWCFCKENKFGMIYFCEKEMKKYIKDGIYMNIALD